MPISLCISTYSLCKWRRAQNKSLNQTIQWIAQTGVPFIEFSGIADEPVDQPIKIANQLRKQCEKQKLQVASYCTTAKLLVSPAKQKKAITELKKQVDIAAALGAPSMRHDVTWGFDKDYPTFTGKKTFAAAIKIVTPAIREVADYAQTLGIKTSFENHGLYLQAPARVCQLLKAVNHPNFGLTMDMGNFLCSYPDPVDAVKQCVGYAQMIHVKDFHQKLKKQAPQTGFFATTQNYALRGAILGHGVVDIPAQLKILKQAKYNGPISLEFEGLKEPTFAVQMGLEYLRIELKKLKML